MEISLIDLLPNTNRRDDATGDLSKLVEDVMQPVLDLLIGEAERWELQQDVDLADEQMVDALLDDLGNPFTASRDLTLNRKRLLARNLITLYKSKGTESAIVSVVRIFTGVEVLNVVSPAPELGGWVLDVDSIDDDPTAYTGGVPASGDWATLGASPGYGRFSFSIEVDQVLTADQKALIREVIDVVKPAHTHFVEFIEP